MRQFESRLLASVRFEQPASCAAVRGVEPRWRPDGKEIFFIAQDGSLMVLPWDPPFDSSRPPQPKMLFKIRTMPGDAPYDVTADGRRFLVARPVDSDRDVPITIIVNWPKLLQQ